LIQNDLPEKNSLPPAPPASQPQHVSDHLANERTFLAWIRTSISIIGLGFVVAKFSVWLRELAPRLGGQVPPKGTGISLPLGIGMMGCGGLVAMLAAWRYRRVRRAIDGGGPVAGGHTMTGVAIMILAITAALVIYMLITG
jgi:putative membrane protein